jgi:hypothetical protein
MLTDRDTAKKRILMTLHNDIEISESFLEEQRLVKCLKDARPAYFREGQERLENHHAQMRRLPILREIIDGPENSATMQLDDIGDI